MSEVELRSLLRRIDGRGYGAYRDLKGRYSLEGFELLVDHVQGDPFAAPSRFRAQVREAGFPESLFSNSSRRIGLEDYLLRAFSQEIKRVCQGNRGGGRSGEVAVDVPGQEMLERTAVQVHADGTVEARFTVGLPARGRTVLGRQAEAILLDEVPRLVKRALLFGSLNLKRLEEHVQAAEDQDCLRRTLAERGLVAFVANGSLLPRASGVDDRPLKSEGILFQSPASLEVTLELPNRGAVSGMGIPEGITLIVGGGFHGKSTLLNALARGVYNHRPGDGREWVSSLPETVKIRAEDGRRVEKVDISPFIDHLPLGRDTHRFCSDNASGSTSQAANIVESVALGARCLLIDEDTSATNFMIRDARMQELVADEREPITPLIDRIRSLYEQGGVSTILVMGGSGDYFDVADRVIMMDGYQPVDVTARAFEIRDRHPTGRHTEGGDFTLKKATRRPHPSSFDPSQGRRSVRIDARGLSTVSFGDSNIDLWAQEQLVHTSQTRAIGWLLYALAERYLTTDGLEEDLRRLMADVQEKGLDSVAPYPMGELAMPRLFEVGAALNRMRTLNIR